MQRGVARGDEAAASSDEEADMVSCSGSVAVRTKRPMLCPSSCGTCVYLASSGAEGVGVGVGVADLEPLLCTAFSPKGELQRCAVSINGAGYLRSGNGLGERLSWRSPSG